MSVTNVHPRPLVAVHGTPGRLAQARQLFALMQQHAREGHLGVLHQAWEMARLKLTHDIGIHYYQMAGMWRRDMPWSEKVGHLGARDYIKALETANPMPYRKLVQHKLPEKALLTLLGLPTPRFLGLARVVGGRTADGLPLATVDDFERFLATLPVDRICFKVMEGHGGRGFLPVSVTRTATGALLVPLDGSESETAAEFFARHVESQKNGRLIEEYLEQHPAFAQFNETSVNTLRILVYARPGDGARALGGYLRIGRRGAMVDNHVAGGIVAGVDVQTGVLGPAFDGTAARQVYPAHPDSGRPIEGVRLPYWEESLRLTEAAMNAFPHLRFAGFDIAVAPTGPVIIEINNYPGLDGVASTNLRLAEVFRE
jgi:Sugar-transfer associated ATP-grasp